MAHYYKYQLFPNALGNPSRDAAPPLVYQSLTSIVRPFSLLMRRRVGRPNFVAISALCSEMLRKTQTLLNGGKWVIVSSSSLCTDQIFHRTMQSYIPHLSVSHLTCFLHKHHLFRVNGCSATSWGANRLWLIAVCAYYLGSKTFEELVIMNSAWGLELYNMAAWTTPQLEEINLFDFEEMLAEKGDLVDWDKKIDYEIEV